MSVLDEQLFSEIKRCGDILEKILELIRFQSPYWLTYESYSIPTAQTHPELFKDSEIDPPVARCNICGELYVEGTRCSCTGGTHE